MRRIGITVKLVSGVASILIGLGLAVTWYSVSQLDQLLSQQMRERVEAQARNWIEANTIEIGITGDEATLQSRVGDLRKGSWIAYVVLSDAQGRLRVAAGLPEGVPETQPAAAETAVQWSETQDAQGLRYIELTTPISPTGTGMSTDLEAMYAAAQPPQGAPLGQLRVGVDRQEFVRRLNVFRWRNIELAALLVLLAVGASLLFAKRMVTPISDMSKVATRIATGDLSPRVHKGADLHDEVGHLVRNINLMAAKLQENREEMDLLYAGLEEKVQQRTEELEEAYRQLEERDKRKSRFLSDVQHQLLKPLTPVKFYTERLLDDAYRDPNDKREKLRIINESADRMKRLVLRLLELTRIEDDVVTWRMGDTDLLRIIRDSLELLEPSAAGKGIGLEIAARERMQVHADADRIHDVITNLVDNAIKFCGRGDRIEIRLTRNATRGPKSVQQGEYALVCVSDTGPGIPPEEQESVFERFYRGKEIRSQTEGTGLGLPISRAIVLHHQGEIWVESEMGAGSSFHFTVPTVTTDGFSDLRVSAGGERRS